MLLPFDCRAPELRSQCLTRARDLPGESGVRSTTTMASPSMPVPPSLQHRTYSPTCLTSRGRKLEDYIKLMEVQPMYRLIWSDGDRFDYVRDEATMVKQIAERSQSDAEGYQVLRICKEGLPQRLHGTCRLRPFLKFSDMMAVSPSLIKLRADRSSTRPSQSMSKTITRQALEFPFLARWWESVPNLIHLHAHSLS